MNTPSLRSRIRNGTLLLLVLAVGLGIYALPRVYHLGGAIRATLYRNYVSIEAANHMHAALRVLQIAELEGQGREVLPVAGSEFRKWLAIEDGDFTEAGEPALAREIGDRARALFDDIQQGAPSARHDRDFALLHQRLDDLIAMNQAAMFRADSRAMRLGVRLTYEFGAGLIMLLVVGAAISWWLGWTLPRPLTELAERLHGISQHKTPAHLGTQKLAELEAVAREFNQMTERLEHYERVNVEMLVYEKSKTEAIIESLEDGVVLIDNSGNVTHINEIAAIILGLEARDALGSPFDDLSTNSPHYLRVRDALRTLGQGLAQSARTEVQLHVRGRDHSYVLKPIPLRHTAGEVLGTLLILQDVTYIRDQDRARTNLVATLSHELRTPLTGLALSIELLRRNRALDARQLELVDTLTEECTRMRQLADNLLNLARGEMAAIAIQSTRLRLPRLAEDVTRRFLLQAEGKRLQLRVRLDENVPDITGDPVKISWVLSNLIGNAIRYTPVGGSIDVAVSSGPDGHARLEVSDTGPGIAREFRDHIFERFAQYENDGEAKGSAGLGLAIAKDIVQAHGGRIWVEGNASSGSHFIVDLPPIAH